MRRSLAAITRIILLVAVAGCCFSPAPTAADAFLVFRARSDIGKSSRDLGLNRNRLWCSEYLRRLTGAHDVDDRAFSWKKRPRTSPRIGVVAVLKRGKSGGHVGVVSGFEGKNPKIISGNHNGVVGEAVYPRSRVIAWVMP